MTSTQALAQRLQAVRLALKKYNQLQARKLQAARIEMYDPHTGKPLVSVPSAVIMLPAKCAIDCPLCR